MTDINQTPETGTRWTRRRRVRMALWSVGALALAALFLVGGYYWASSSQFENWMRKKLVTRLETATGCRVELGLFHWHLLDLDAEAGDLVLHGREAAGEAPYVRVERMHVKISILQVLSPKILLRELEIRRPAIHLIVYSDGTTNQPQPRTKQSGGKPALDTLFDLKAGRLALEEGVLDYDNRAANFDSQHRKLPLELTAHDVSTVLNYVPSSSRQAESYHIEAGARDVRFARGGGVPAVEGYFQATADLMRNAVFLRALRVTARSKGVPDRSLTISGAVVDFKRPYWKVQTQGELDLRLVEPITGYRAVPEGVARIDLSGEGGNGRFRIDGPIHADRASYVDGGVDARGVTLDARVHADPEQLLISSIIARLAQGGQLEGTVALDHWLAPIPGEAQAGPASAIQPKSRWRFGRKPKTTTAPAVTAPAQTVNTSPLNGKVTAAFKNVPIDAVMDIVGEGPFQRLGLATLLNGPASATWSNGDVRTLEVSANLKMNPSRSITGETPASGVIDGTYTQHDGAVDLRTLEVNMPSSRLEAHGHLGAYPVDSPSQITVDLRSQNLAEFDPVLRDLGLRRAGRSGSAALPIALGGQMEFRGTWGGSLVDPHLAGALTATNLSVELPANNANSPARSLHLDEVDAAGSYSATRVALDRGQFSERGATIHAEGSLTAADTAPRKLGVPSFDNNSLLRVRLTANKVSAAELLSIAGEDLPVTGDVSAQIQTDGPLRALDGSGWVELDNSVIYDEPIGHIRAQGRIAGHAVQLASVTLNDDAGKLSATGSYDLQSQNFQVSAHGAGINIGRIKRMQSAGVSVNGQASFTLSGGGTFNDPHLDAKGTLSKLTLGDEPVGSVEVMAHTVNRTLYYDLTTEFQAATLTAHGQTALSGDYATEAKLAFSKFNIAGPLKLMHVPGLTGESELAGTITVQGPLKHVEALRGDAHLADLAVTLAGVHLHSDGPVHATLANGRIALDPLHITGEATDVRAQGGLEIKGNRRLDLAASGSINLKLAETLDPDLTANGTTTFQVEAHGPLSNPGLRGRIDFQNASLALEDLPNSLSQLKGTLEFNQNRLEVRSLTAVTGGGQLSVGGYLAYQQGIYADLTVNGKGVRIRYPDGVSSLADANLRIQGTQNTLLLSGGILITRFTVSPDLDLAALATRATKAQPVAAPDAPSNHVRLDVHILSSPQLNFQNAYAKLAGDVDLRLRGTLATPSLLGRVSITEGSATLAGTRYELQRGDITFSNPVRIEPSIDLNATARVEDYDITLGLHGSPQKMNVSYRSDPPLPEADVVALLALGRTQNEQHIYGQQQEQGANSQSTDVLLGGALNATVSSRVQKLFGAGAVKVDPTYLGALGNSTTRITVEEQIGKNLTLTYATDVNTTAQQLLQAEVAINRHVSLLVTRDESGVFSMVVKATRRYR
ncbi:MAG: translocation/assembly module TamB domain-containing protein [Terracidiphilus sp.]|nr:translocation/assembly module TamB domain-containing protein [Terracidiphilus sp.]